MKKNGFTLIELLAVILVLAIIMLIAFPSFMKIIVEAKKNAFKVSVENIVDAINVRSIKKEYELNPIIVTESNLSEMLGISNDNFENIELLRDSEDKIYIIAEGKNQYNGFTACGYSKEINISSIEICSVDSNFYSNSQISSMIASGYIPISTAEELNNIRNNSSNIFGSGTSWSGTYVGGLDKKYVQVKDIDLGIAPFNENEGWIPLGTNIYNCNSNDEIILTGEIFSGVYDGAWYKISNLYINSSTSTIPIGLFSTSSGSFKNIYLDNTQITNGTSTPTGGLVGLMVGTAVTVTNVNISGNVTSLSTSEGKTGGFVGQIGQLAKLSITKSHYVGNVTSGYHQVGGFIGQIRDYNQLLIADSTVKGNILSTYNRTGGFIGEASYTGYTDSNKFDYEPLYATIATADSLIIRDSYYQGEIISDYNKIGGLIGEIRNSNALIIDGAYADTNIISDYNLIGGLVGESALVRDISITDSHHDGTILSGYNKTGGLVGGISLFTNLTTLRSYHNGNITSDFNFTGGLFGEINWIGNDEDFTEVLNRANSVLIKDSYAKGDILSDFTSTAGIIGSVNEVNTVTINNTDYDGNLNGGFSAVAGIIGTARSVSNLIIQNVEVNSIVKGENSSLAGIVGTIDYIDNCLIDNAIFLGSIQNVDPLDSTTNVGGIIGKIGTDETSYGSITKPENYTSNVTISNSSVEADIETIGTRIGGLVGSADKTLTRTDNINLTINSSYFKGNIIVNNSFPATSYKFSIVGGLVGNGDVINITNSYAIGVIESKIEGTPLCEQSFYTNNMIGGLVGSISTSTLINNSYAAVDIVATTSGNPVEISKTNNIKALVGDYTKATVNNSYYDSEVEDYGDLVGFGKTTTELKTGAPNSDLFNNWDFNVWNFDSNTSYPTLK